MYELDLSAYLCILHVHVHVHVCGEVCPVNYLHSISTLCLTQDGDTALHIAMRYGHSHCVITLLSHPGMDPNIKNENGLTAMNVQTCAYGKVMLCGHSGAGKSTLTEVSL